MFPILQLADELNSPLAQAYMALFGQHICYN